MDKLKGKSPSLTVVNNPDKPKPKRTNEKRKEKSRDAARCRRSRETEIFTELAQVLPLRREDVEQLDKASVMRLSIVFLKVRDMLNLFPKIKDLPEIEPESESKVEEKPEDSQTKQIDILNAPEARKLMTEALDGFLMILSSEGDVTFVSDNISEFLGIAQIDILGQQIWEYAHQCDHDEIKDALNLKSPTAGLKDEDKEKDNTKQNDKTNDNGIITAHRDFFIRLKCTLTSRGRNVNIKSASYKVIHVTGHVVMNSDGDRILIAVGRPLPHPSNIEIPLGSTTFLTKHSLDMKFTYADDKMLSLLGYEPEDLLGKSLYDCHHGGDSESLMTTFKNVLSKGQSETCRYRFLGKYGGFSWLVTQATMVYDKQKPQSVVCVNYVISDIENDHEIYSCAQLEANSKKVIKSNQQKEQDTNNNGSKQETQQELENHHQQIQQKSEDLIIKEKLQEQEQQQPSVLVAEKNKVIIIENSPITNTTTATIPTVVNENHIEKYDKCIFIKETEDQQQQKEQQSNSLHNQEEESNDKFVVKREIFNNNNNNNTITNNYRRREPISLSPIRRTLVNCSISSNNNNSNNNKSKQNYNNINNQKDNIQRPKSVTASVFTQVPSIPRAQSVTASVFTPLSSLPKSANRPKFLGQRPSIVKNNNNINNNNNKNMNKGFSIFSVESPDLTMLKEEPDDLTHLAPTAGDACIPLEEPTPLFGEMLDGFILPDSYGTLLPDDINSLDSQQSNCNNNKIHVDPFINYRDESSDTSNSPHLLSPGGASKSPEVSSLPSLCSPNSLSQEDEFAFMTMNVEDDIDLTMRAPYIPMNEQDDLPLLTDDLMWGDFPEELSLHKDYKDALQMETIKINLNLNSNNSNNNNTSNSINSNTGYHHNQNGNSNESSLAALLCGSPGNNNNNHHNHLHTQHHHSHHQQQQQHQHHHQQQQQQDEPSESKRSKLIEHNDNENSLVDSIDAFGHVFSKNTSNIDCWTMNDLLQLNTTTNTALNNQENLQEDSKQNIILNSTTIPTTTLHVPLITLQQNNIDNKRNINKIRPSDVINNNDIAGNSNTPQQQQHNKKLSTTKLSTISGSSPGVVTATVYTTNKNTNHTNNCNNINIIENGGTIINAICTNHKRPSNVASSLDSKRVKGSPHIEIQTSPQLLQQLMAPTPQRHRTKSAFDKINQSGRWNIDGGGNGQQPNGLPPPASNSVLKNLLVSGCDCSFPSRPPDTTISDDHHIQDSLHDEGLSRKCFSHPLRCTTSTAQLIRNCCPNPLIGGVSVLPSPPMTATISTNDEGGGGCTGEKSDNGSNPNTLKIHQLMPMRYSPDSRSNDSGIECGNQLDMLQQSIHQMPTSATSELSSVVLPVGGRGGCGVLKDTQLINDKLEIIPQNNVIKMNSFGNLPIDAGGGGGIVGLSGDGNGTQSDNGKLSFPFLDNANPLCSSFLMDLCSDDYGINEPMDGDLLQNSEITEAVFDVWPPQLV